MPGMLCEHCTGVCCQYIALPLETPESRGDFDDIRWYLLHENVSVFVEDGDWYICLATRCRHLLDDFRCAIYASRPRICRQYTTENCDYHSGDYEWEAHFTCPEHLDEYLRARRRVEQKSKNGRVSPTSLDFRPDKNKKISKQTRSLLAGKIIKRLARQVAPHPGPPRPARFPESRP